MKNQRFFNRKFVPCGYKFAGCEKGMGISIVDNFVSMKEGERMIEMPTDIQFKDELRKERIRIEDELEMLHQKEYDLLERKLERDLARVNEGLQS